MFLSALGKKNNFLLIIIYLLFFPHHILYADELAIVEKAIFIVDERIYKGIFLSEISDDKTFENEVTRMLEFAYISLGKEKFLTEEWFDLSIYCLARKYKYYKLAINLLKKEYEIIKYHKLRKWIKARIQLLDNSDFFESDFDIKKEVNDLRKIL